MRDAQVRPRVALGHATASPTAAVASGRAVSSWQNDEPVLPQFTDYCVLGSAAVNRRFCYARLCRWCAVPGSKIATFHAIPTKRVSQLPSPTTEDFWAIPPTTLAEALAAHPDPEGLLYGLLRAMYFDITVTRRKTYTAFEVRRPEPHVGPLSELIRLTPDRRIAGRAAADLERTYKIVRGIETELSSAFYSPPELRHRQAVAFRKRVGASEEEFLHVLRNWTKFPLTDRSPGTSGSIDADRD